MCVGGCDFQIAACLLHLLHIAYAFYYASIFTDLHPAHTKDFTFNHFKGQFHIVKYLLVYLKTRVTVDVLSLGSSIM